MKHYSLVDLAAIQDELGGELEAAVLEVVRSQQFIGGEKVAEFERAFADYLGAADVIGVANGTDAIELSLKALNLAAGRGGARSCEHVHRDGRSRRRSRTGSAIRRRRRS